MKTKLMQAAVLGLCGLLAIVAFAQNEQKATDFIDNAGVKVAEIDASGNAYFVGIEGDTLSVAESAATSSVVNVGGSISLAEQAAADADTAGYGQVWVDLATPNTLMFTDDAGTDFLISGAGGTITGSGSANTVPLWTSGSVLGNSTISQTGGFLDVGDELKLDDGNVGQPSLVFDGNTDAGWFYGSGKIQLGVDGTAVSTWDAGAIDIGHTSTLITLHNDVLIKDDLLAAPYQGALHLINTDEGATSEVSIVFGLTNSVYHSYTFSGSISSAKTAAWGGNTVTYNADLDFYTALWGGSNQALKLTSGGDTWTYGSLGVNIDPATTAGVITAEGSLFLRQQAAADADTVEYGQLWAKDIGEGELWYTDDEGADYLISFNYGGLSNSLLTLLGTVSLRERAAADAATAGYGQLWVKDSSPAELMFRDDTGTDFLIGGGGTGTLTGGGTTNAIAVFTSSSSLGPSVLYDVSDEIGLNTSTPSSLFDVRDTSGAVATLSTSETVVVDGTKLGQLDFSAPQEASGEDALLPGASIWAEADADFSAGVNTTDLVFATGESEAAVERARLTSAGKLDVTGIIEAGSGDTAITTAAGDVIVGSGGSVDDGALSADVAHLNAAETVSADWVNTANPWADDEVADVLTIGATGSVDDGALSANVAHLNAAETIAADWVNTANPWADDEVADVLTIAGGTVNSSAIGGTTPSTGAFTTLSASGASTLTGNVKIGESGAAAQMVHIERADTNVIQVSLENTDTIVGYGASAGLMRIFVGGAEKIRAGAAGATFNQGQVDTDFNVRGVSAPNAFFVQGSDGNVGIGTSTPNAALNVNGDVLIDSGALIRTPAAITTDTTPTAANRAFVIIGAWTAANDITDFDNETAGQVLKILGGDADCNVVDGAAIQLEGDATWNGKAGATLELWSDGTVWYEANRSDAS